MKIANLRITNFRGIRDVEVAGLGTIVVIAGQNGSGKSCVFDAIRLLKSVYGGYQQNEWQQWMGEFQIQLTNRSEDFARMFNDPGSELRITCDFEISKNEKYYIKSRANELLREAIWRTLLPEAYQWGGYKMAMFAAQFREREPEVASRAAEELPSLLNELAGDTIRGECFIPVGGVPQINTSRALSIMFSTFRPQDIGVIDYHGAQRHYGRESVQGINLNLDANQQQHSQTALYNYAQKYNNVKSEMAASYVKEILAEQAGVPMASQSTLTNTLKELFLTFFPEKEFLGPQPTPEGGLSFPVRTQAGSVHDLDELSAGEKEILYGYLRIRNSAPRNSIILLDEPELHLNPRLIRGLPQFYHRNLGEALGNQIWLVTHSDALLREVVGRERYNVFHMLPCGAVPKGEAQLKPLRASADLEMALVDLVGDLAAYHPGGKVVLFEGGGDSDFDQRVASSLFPELQGKVNLISGSNKSRVRALHETLDRASKKGSLPFTFFAITDKDVDDVPSSEGVNMYSWDAYHIENYLIEPKYIRMVLESVGAKFVPAESQILSELKACARETLPDLVRHLLLDKVNGALSRALEIGTNPKKGAQVQQILEAINRSVNRIEILKGGDLSADSLTAAQIALEARYERSLEDGSWLREFRGRDILRRFVGKRATGAPYDIFRNLILSKMRDDGYQPPGMKAVIAKILEA